MIARNQEIMTCNYKRVYLVVPLGVNGFWFISSMLQISGDLEDLESALHKEDIRHVIGTGSCSALIKLLPGNHDLFVSQDTWNYYGNMLRILKKYAFGFHVTPGKTLWESFLCICYSILL